MAVGNTISDYAHTVVHNFFGPLELDDVDALLMLALGRGIASETDSKSKMSKIPKMHECTNCGLRFSSGQALGGHKRAHYEGITTHKRKRAAKPESEYGTEKKHKFDFV